MLDPYFLVKTLHILGSTILFGTGIGIAFFMFMSYFTENIHEKFYASRITVLADYVFTAPAVIIQPLTGIWLIQHVGYNPMDLWLIWTYALYIITGICWLPVVFIQIKLKYMLARSREDGTPLSPHYKKLLKIWFLLGWPAFLGLIAIFLLMVIKPT